jgi:hypothetical protein
MFFFFFISGFFDSNMYGSYSYLLEHMHLQEACVKVAKIPGVSDSDNGGQDTSFLHEVIVVVCKRATYDYICPHRRLFTRLFQRRVAVIRTTTKVSACAWISFYHSERFVVSWQYQCALPSDP